jgi:hypothetical protein
MLDVKSRLSSFVGLNDRADAWKPLRSPLVNEASLALLKEASMVIKELINRLTRFPVVFFIYLVSVSVSGSKPAISPSAPSSIPLTVPAMGLLLRPRNLSSILNPHPTAAMILLLLDVSKKLRREVVDYGGDPLGIDDDTNRPRGHSTLEQVGNSLLDEEIPYYGVVFFG